MHARPLMSVCRYNVGMMMMMMMVILCYMYAYISCINKNCITINSIYASFFFMMLCCRFYALLFFRLQSFFCCSCFFVLPFGWYVFRSHFPCLSLSLILFIFHLLLIFIYAHMHKIMLMSLVLVIVDFFYFFILFLGAMLMLNSDTRKIREARGVCLCGASNGCSAKFNIHYDMTIINVNRESTALPSHPRHTTVCTWISQHCFGMFAMALSRTQNIDIFVYIYIYARNDNNSTSSILFISPFIHLHEMSMACTVFVRAYFYSIVVFAPSMPTNGRPAGAFSVYMHLCVCVFVCELTPKITGKNYVAQMSVCLLSLFGECAIQIRV